MKTIKSISLNFCSGLSLKILIKFLNKLVTGDGFILQSHNNKSYYTGEIGSDTNFYNPYKTKIEYNSDDPPQQISPGCRVAC